ncbi:MAG: hypothetical protein GY862_02345 [Gammaproteobacteria bacterium]|nr:hypothetical protein [Gammaproteobacteria bacterium]
MTTNLGKHEYGKEQTQQLLQENRILARHLIAADEKERKKLTRELHDEFGQNLTAIQAYAHSIDELTQEGKDERIRSSAREIISLSLHMHEAVHSMMQRLYPCILDELGLKDALQSSINAWQSCHMELQCTFDAKGALDKLSEIGNISIYRVLQECLANVAKHARATNVRIRLREEPEQTPESISLCIQDDGKGFDPKHPGLGLIGMRERVQSLGGTFSLKTAPNEGVTVAVFIPV